MRELEREIVAIATRTVASFRAVLATRSLTIDEPRIEVRDASSEGYESEISMYIKKNNKIEDLLEFHIFRNGHEIVTAPEAESWFQEELSKLCE